MIVTVYPSNDINAIVNYENVISCHAADGVYYINYITLEKRVQVIYPLHYLKCITVLEE